MIAGTIIVDRKRCSGSGMCALAAPGMFDQTDVDGTVVVLVPVVTGDDVELARECAENCPAQAISVTVTERWAS